jgi:3-hydroxyacyl-CoA dehydrogenase
MTMTKIALVGAGVVGSSWSIVFARAGYEVRVYDAKPSTRDGVIASARSVAADLAAHGLIEAAEVEPILARIKVAESLEAALAGASYVQESAPERLEVKTALYRDLDRLIDPGTIIGSSTSGLPASSFTSELKNRARCLVVHPIIPPHLSPLVEIVPAPWTAPEVVERASELMRAVGQSPIRLSREINGFVVNRLQSALLGEAFRLVEDGICSAADVDAAVADGLGLRWSFMGPFQTIDLNAAKGVAEYCRTLGPMYYGLAKEQADPRPWGPELVGSIEGQLRTTAPADRLAEKRAWRDSYLADLRAFKRSRDG